MAGKAKDSCCGSFMPASITAALGDPLIFVQFFIGVGVDGDRQFVSEKYYLRPLHLGAVFVAFSWSSKCW